MAVTPKTLTKATTFSRTTPAGFVVSLTLQVGEAYRYERTEDATHVTHIGRVTRDGYVWTTQQRMPKHPGTLTVPAAPVAPAVIATPAPVQAAPVVITPPAVPRTIRNDKSGDEVTTTLTNAELAAAFAETAPTDSWIDYWMAKTINDRQQAPKFSDMIAFLADSFVLATGMGLKRPMIRLHYKGARYKVYLSKRGTLCFKRGDLNPGTQDPTGDEEYMGCLSCGRFLANDRRDMTEGDKEVISGLSANPVGFLATASKDMCRCCYCGQPLEDDRSKKVGYGKTCATRWGLPWGQSDYDNKVPSFAQMWQGAAPDDRTGLRGVCQAIRQTPRDSMLWSVLGDIMEGAGYAKRPTMPAAGTALPCA